MGKRGKKQKNYSAKFKLCYNGYARTPFELPRNST